MRARRAAGIVVRRVRARRGVRVDVDLPDLGGVVGAAGGELLDVGREQDPGDVFLVCGKLGYG